MAVNETLEGVDVHSQSGKCPASVVVPLAHHSKEQVVRSDAVAAGPHRLLTGVFDDAVQLVGYLYHREQR